MATNIVGYIEYRSGIAWEYYSRIDLMRAKLYGNIWSNLAFGEKFNLNLPDDVSIGLKLEFCVNVLKKHPLGDDDIRDYILLSEAEKFITNNEGEWLFGKKDKLFLYPEISWITLPILRELSDRVEKEFPRRLIMATIATMEVLSNGDDKNSRFFCEYC